ncbi:DoxX family protein [Thermus scotoductus]|uniref:DoxX family protein n=3 Tax=Thermus scotoductus TaxID=37636 RepID=A0A430RDF0_THESC|nr:DoxX family protein [Thermus scotoductus]RTH05405.1 DoxX family protein [Thermus scotoductus]RTH20221.1 DoxX family protein [Thermus scotoductus]RTI01479.1 DoxX family protein [Thermus scotoductus]RTI22257.1 DoxX family protein [Thermus scotoductus]
MLIGRILYGGFFLLNGINHFLMGQAMIGYAQSKGVPAPALAVYGSGILILLGGLSVLLGYQVQVGLWLLVAFLVPVSLTMHNFWAIQDPQQRMVEQVNFMKNMALLGAALMLLSLWK